MKLVNWAKYENTVNATVLMKLLKWHFCLLLSMFSNNFSFILLSIFSSKCISVLIIYIIYHKTSNQWKHKWTKKNYVGEDLQVKVHQHSRLDVSV